MASVARFKCLYARYIAISKGFCIIDSLPSGIMRLIALYIRLFDWKDM